MTTIKLNLDTMSDEQWERTRAMIDSYYGVVPHPGNVVDENEITGDITFNGSGIQKFGANPSIDEDGLNADGTEKQHGDCESTITDSADDTIDKDGLPWDHRIHSSSKVKNKDGRWKKKKGVSEELYEEVVRELKNIPDKPVTPEPSSPPVPPSGASPDPAVGGPSTTNTTAPAAGVPVWPEVNKRLMESVRNKQTDPVAVSEWLTANGCEGGIPMLANRSDLYNAFIEAFDL